MKNYILLLQLLIYSSTMAKLDENQHSIEEIFNSIISNTTWSMDSFNISGSSEPVDRFGQALADGDFNGDGWQDLAIGIPNYDVLLGLFTNSGTVLILYGTEDGISQNNNQFLYQEFGSANGVEDNDFFGTSLSSGDFNCDGFNDLVVGTPNESYTVFGDVRNNAGAINIFYGSVDGFDGDSSLFSQGTGTSIGNNAIEPGDRFGWSFAVGNFNGDSVNGRRCMDLAVSAPFEDYGQQNQILDGGIVHVYYGNPSGISGDNRDTLSQNTFGVINSQVQSNDQFGYSLAAGRFSNPLGARYFDLAIGVPGEDIDGVINAGAVQVFDGAASGLQTNAANNIIWSQSGNIAGVVEANDRFGVSLSAADFNSDNITDLVVGVPREDLGNISNAGTLNIIYGNISGLTEDGNHLINQDSTGIGGDPMAGYNYGETLATGYINEDFFFDLVVGIPAYGSQRGAFNVIYGGPDGLSGEDSDFRVNSAIGDEKGYAVTVGNFGGGQKIAVGVPGDNSVDDENDTGTVQIFGIEVDLIFADSFDG